MKNKKHIHEYKYVGSGTNLVEQVSDVQYKCYDCGKQFLLLLLPEKYFERKYPKVMMIEDL